MSLTFFACHALVKPPDSFTLINVMNFIDLLLILLVLANVLLGWRRGFILGVLDLLRWIAGFLLALRFYQPVARWFVAHLGWTEVWSVPIAFLFVAMVSGLFIQLLGYQLLKRLSADVHGRRLNRIAGIVPGFISGLIFAAIIAPLLLSLPLPERLSTPTRESAVANRLATFTERLETVLHPIFDEALRQTINMRTIRPESDERAELPFKVSNTRPRPELEAEMLSLVNQERASAGLPPLAPDPELTEVARHHSADMFARGYFAHVTPEGRSPFDRMKDAGVHFLTAGENLALAPTLSIAHNGLMNSPGHRANILRPQFGRVGIGIMDGGIRGLMITQNFRN